MKPSEEFLVSPIGEAVADYGESCEEASLAHDNREARLFHTEMADKHLATVERLIAERVREIRRQAIEESPLLLAASKLADVDGRTALLQDTDFDALDDEWHDAIREVCRCAREVHP